MTNDEGSPKGRNEEASSQQFVIFSFVIPSRFAILSLSCLMLTRHEVDVHFDARSIVLQNHCRGDDVFAALQAGFCRSKANPRTFFRRSSSDLRGQAK